MTEKAERCRKAIEEATSKLLATIGAPPRLGLVLGSGLGPLAGRLENCQSVPYPAILGMPKPMVPGHSGRLTIGGFGGVRTACLEGRVHLYEGHQVEDVVFGVRLLARLGCAVVVLTNAAGATTPKRAPGTIMLISDHINLTGHNPLVGWTHPTEFIDLSQAYDSELRDQMRAAALEAGIRLDEGIYAGVMGPSYETKAEVSYLAQIGADAVGMSTVLETIALREQRVRVVALSCITNAAAGVVGAVLDHAHVQQVARNAAAQMEALIVRWTQRVFGAPAPNWPN